ncbi:MAG: NADH-quinone oxidoreductase subunit H 2 [Oligoflexia bacterium]|nr:MAG: NADH-quinone oxidoreductase subunit H 2 [Oligoflexia bacterium]
MGNDIFEITVNCVKLIIVFLLMVQAVPVLVWLERRGSAFIQNRFGPNRVGPLGLLQLLADAVKFLFKEEFIPEHGIRFLYYGAPVMALVPATLAFAAIPLGYPLQWDSYIFRIQGFEVNVGIVYVLGASSLAVYSILMAGFGSGNKYSLMGALRATAQVVSYELALGLAIVGAILLYGTFNLTEMVAAQQGSLQFAFMGHAVNLSWLPNWGIFYQPLGAVIFFAATFAESNRLPFDLAEGEAELVAGFHTEYGGFKMLLFFIGEYGHMMVGSALMIVFYLGGYGIPGVTIPELQQWAAGVTSSANAASALVSLITFVSFTVKLAVFMWIFIQVRWTLPRFRYDQLMELGWKTMLPWALGNTILTAIVLYIAKA